MQNLVKFGRIRWNSVKIRTLNQILTTFRPNFTGFWRNLTKFWPDFVKCWPNLVNEYWIPSSGSDSVPEFQNEIWFLHESNFKIPNSPKLTALRYLWGYSTSSIRGMVKRFWSQIWIEARVLLSVRDQGPILWTYYIKITF